MSIFGVESKITPMNHWDQSGIPHKGWHCSDCHDTGGEEGDGYETCQMCGNERIRYVHIMEHQEYPNELRVGCICAGKMSDDYVGPKKREQVLRNKASKRSNLFKRKWKISFMGNEYLKISNRRIVIMKNLYSPGWEYAIGVQWSKGNFSTSDEAKRAAFDQLQILLNELRD